MKEIYVLVDKETGDLWKPEGKGYYSQPKRKTQAYTSEARALNALKNFHPKQDESKVKVVRYVPYETR